jgi:hypothetical protein
VSFSSPVNIIPPLAVIAGVVALALGYRTAGWLLIGVPFVLGLLIMAWALIAGLRQKPPESE